jgi:beta-lactamase class A
VIGRRQFLLGAGAAGLALIPPAAAQDPAFADIERQAKGRLGVAILDTGTGKRLSYRGDERFALLSTFKVLAAGVILTRVDRGQEKLDRVVSYAESDLVTYSPETKKHAGAGMTLAAICEAAITLSDNTAGNLMLASFGGPQGLTAAMRALGDNVTRLDRIETELNEAKHGDPRDTTSPNAMADTLRKLLTGDALSASSRKQLADWMVASKTGNARLRAGLPAGWRMGDKTGSSERNANDVAIVWPPDRAPLIVASYLAESGGTPQERDTAHAAVGRVAAAWRG